MYFSQPTLSYRVTNVDVHYKAVRFYLEQHPRLVASLLSAQNERIDPGRVVNISKEMGRLPLIKKFLQVKKNGFRSFFS